MGGIRRMTLSTQHMTALSRAMTHYQGNSNQRAHVMRCKWSGLLCDGLHFVAVSCKVSPAKCHIATERLGAARHHHTHLLFPISRSFTITDVFDCFRFLSERCVKSFGVILSVNLLCYKKLNFYMSASSVSYHLSEYTLTPCLQWARGKKKTTCSLELR